MTPDKFNLLGDETAARNAAGVIIREVTAERIERREDYEKNWQMYQGNHERYFKQRLDEESTLFTYRSTNCVKSNWCGFTVDLSSKYLYGKASKVIRKYSKNKTTDQKMRDLVKPFHMESFMLDVSKKASIFGEQTVRIIPIDTKNKIQVVGKTNSDTLPFPILMDAIRTYPKLNRWGRLAAVVSQYFATDYKNGKKFSITELVTDDSRWEWRTEGTLDILLTNRQISSVAPLDGATLIASSPNTYGLEDEFIHLPNNDDLRSDLVDIIDLNIALDEAYTDKQHFFQKHGWPQMVTEVSLENVAHSPNRIWEITPDMDDKKKVLDRMGFLTWDGKMEDHAKFVKNLERNIMIMSYTAAISTGDLEAIGQLRSGPALITAHSVAIHKTEGKQIVWSRNEKNLINAMASMDSFFQNEKVEGRYPELNPEIHFPRDFVPGADLERATIQQLQLNSHTRTLLDILEENHGNIGEEELMKKRAQVIADSKEITDSVREFKTEEKPASGASGPAKQKSTEQKKPVS